MVEQFDKPEPDTNTDTDTSDLDVASPADHSESASSIISSSTASPSSNPKLSHLSISHPTTGTSSSQAHAIYTHKSTAQSLSNPTDFSRAHPRVDVIFNEVSGQRDPHQDLTTIIHILSHSFADLHLWTTLPDYTGSQAAQDALSCGATVLIACGGDGTVAQVAETLRTFSGDVKKGIFLGVIPRGTANALCTALHIPSDVDEAASMIATGVSRNIDFPAVHGPHSQQLTTSETPDNTASVSATNDSSDPSTSVSTSTSIIASPSHPSTSSSQTSSSSPKSMLLLCGIGFEARTVKKASRRLKRALGIAAYALAGLQTAVNQATFETLLTLDGVSMPNMPFTGGQVDITGVTKIKHVQLQGVTIANAAPPASVLAQGVSGGVIPDDGLLEIVCIASMHPLGLISTMFSLFWAALSGKKARHVNKHVFGMRARKIRVDCYPPQPVVIDGESMGFTPIEIELDNREKEKEKGKVGDRVTVIAPNALTVSKSNKSTSRGMVRMFRNIRGLSIFAIVMTIVTRRSCPNDR